MDKPIQLVLVILFALSYLVSPIALFWGWVRWVKGPKLRTLSSILSLCGFILTTASGVLAVTSLAYAQAHSFGYYDPSLLRIFRVGVLLSFAGLCLGICGAWRTNPLRWFSPVSAIGTLTFWFFAAAGE